MNTENQKNSKSVVIEFFKKLTFNELKLRTKIQLVLLTASLITILIISIVGVTISHNSSIKTGINQLAHVTDAKKQLIENYFTIAQDQAKLMAGSDMVINAMSEFKEAFSNIVSDNYTTPEANNIDQMKDQLNDFYTNDFLPLLSQNSDEEITGEKLFPENKQTVILQYLYIAENSRAIGEKLLYNRATDASQYSSVHEKFQVKFREYLENFGYDDILLVDNTTGNVIYSVAKNTDFATNLNNGAYNRSLLAETYRRINSEQSKNSFYISDMGFYIPAGLNPVMFIAYPIYDGSEKTGVILFEISSSHLGNLLATDKSDAVSTQNLQNDFYIVGDDNLLRTNDPALLRDFNRNIRLLKKSETADAMRIEKLKNTALSMKVPYILTGADNGLSDYGRNRSFNGKLKLFYYTPLSINGLKWTLVGDVPQKEIVKSGTEIKILLFTALIILVLIYLFGRRFSAFITDKIEKISTALRNLSMGESYEKIQYNTKDEIGGTITELNNVISRVDEASRFTLKVGEGDFDAEFALKSEHDRLGLAMTKMKESLQKAREEEEKRKVEDEILNWTNQGIAKFNDLLRQDNHDMEKLSYNLVRNLIEYLSANIGGLYILEGEEDDREKYLKLIAAFAYDRRKYEDKRIEIGEGLIGNCYLEKQTIFLKEIPDDYIKISTGMGFTKPRSLMIVPLKIEEDVLGIIEIGSLEVFKPYEIEFVERVAANTAATLVTVKLNTKTAELLSQSKLQAEQTASQEEELRQNLEEMQATQEEMKRKEEKLKQVAREMEEKEKMLLKEIEDLKKSKKS